MADRFSPNEKSHYDHVRESAEQRAKKGDFAERKRRIEEKNKSAPSPRFSFMKAARNVVFGMAASAFTAATLCFTTPEINETLSNKYSWFKEASDKVATTLDKTTSILSRKRSP